MSSTAEERKPRQVDGAAGCRCGKFSPALARPSFHHNPEHVKSRRRHSPTLFQCHRLKSIQCMITIRHQSNMGEGLITVHPLCYSQLVIYEAALVLRFLRQAFNRWQCFETSMSLPGCQCPRTPPFWSWFPHLIGDLFMPPSQ